MSKNQIIELSAQLKDIAKDLSFLGHPRYPTQSLLKLFPEHHDFISKLEDVSVPFPVDVDGKRRAMDLFLKELAKADIPDEVKHIFSTRIVDYHLLLTMMESFNSVFFYDNCVKLYGTCHKHINNQAFYYFIEKVPEFCMPDHSSTTYQGEEAIHYVKNRMLETFGPDDFEVKPSTSLLSDASAGRRTLKLNPIKTFTSQHLDLLLVHEGWVHLGTSLNGAAQVDQPWLGTWAPRTTFMQEGLAVLTELITGTMTTERWNKIVLRHLATSMAEKGSSIKDVYAYLRHHDMEDLDAFKLALRVFRGVPLEGGMAFTKELLYLHGMIELLYHLHFFKADLKSVWLGKLSFEEHVILLDNWEKLNPTIKYFPEGLNHPVVQGRLQRLKELSFSLFHHGFL